MFAGSSELASFLVKLHPCLDVLNRLFLDLIDLLAALPNLLVDHDYDLGDIGTLDRARTRPLLFEVFDQEAAKFVIGGEGEGLFVEVHLLVFGLLTR